MNKQLQVIRKEIDTSFRWLAGLIWTGLRQSLGLAVPPPPALAYATVPVMARRVPRNLGYAWVLALALLVGFLLAPTPAAPAVTDQPATSFIVQGRDLTTVANLVRGVGGTVTHELGIINAVGAQLSADQQARLARDPRVSHVFPDRQVMMAAGPSYSVTAPAVASRWLKQAAPNQNMTGGLELPVRESAGASYRAVYRFDLAAVPVDALVTSATVSFWVESQNNYPVNVHRITDSWSEGSVNWGNTANDFDPAIVASFTPNDEELFIPVTITSLVQQWMAGTAANHGLMLVGTASQQLSEYTGRDWPRSSQRPYLTITYTMPPDTTYSQLVGASQLHTQGIAGDNVTVAVVDTGLLSHRGLNTNRHNQARVLVQYNAITNQLTPPGLVVTDDDSGHGSHVSSVIADRTVNVNGGYNGIAPGVQLFTVKAFNADGVGSYLDVIRGIDWVVANRTLHNIRVLNLSFSSPPQSYYWEDPLNQAVMRAWQAGIVVVAAAGNRGPNPMTIGVPGNV
ncbi:MAG: DNRLRE domain-containing protein, partial [Chloroflexota bacterium]